MRRLIFYSFIIGWAGGLALTEHYSWCWWWFVVGGGMITVAYWRRWLLISALILGIFVSGGREWWWLRSADAAWRPLNNQATEFTGVVETVSGGWSRVSKIKADRSLPGSISIRIVTKPGDRIRWKCRPQLIIGSQVWRNAAQRILAQCDPDVIVKVSQDRGWGRLYSWRAKVTATIYQHLRSAEGSLAVGILFGDRADFPPAIAEAFRRTGTTHIIALSGFNVTIILSSLMNPLMKLLGRRRAAVVGGAAVLLFIIMTGASASVVRAGIMAMIAQISSLAGRPISAERLLGYTILLVSWGNPLLLWHDLGFQLSITSTLGLMKWSKPIVDWLKHVPAWGGIRENLATTLAATAASLPLTMLAFQRLSIISPLVNIVALPLVPWAMATAALLGVGGAIWPAIGRVIMPMTELIHHAILRVIAVGAAWSWSAVSISGPAAAAVTVILIYYLSRYEAQKTDH